MCQRGEHAVCVEEKGAGGLAAGEGRMRDDMRCIGYL